MDAPQAAAMVKRYPDVIVGIKTAHWEAPDWTAVDRAIEAGILANVPVMVEPSVRTVNWSPGSYAPATSAPICTCG